VSVDQKSDQEAREVLSGSPEPEPEANPAWIRGRLAASAVVRWLERYSLLVLLLITIAFFGFFWGRTASTFMQVANFQNIIRSQTVLAVLALGVIVPLVCNQFDLGIALGTLAGVVNGAVVTRLGVSSFIATLGSAAVITGIVNWYTGGISIIQGIPSQLTDFGGGNWLGIPSPFYVVALVALLVYYLLEHTPYGRNLHAVGSNPESARLVGLAIPRIVFLSFAVSGAAAGLGGVLLVADSGAGNPSVGSVFTLTALTAAFLGATSVKPGRFNVVGTLLAISFLAAAITGLTFAGVQDYINDLFTGFALVLAVGISVLLARRRLGGAR
jgi:ribose transport system permease protein